uniref:Cytoskeleton-associated protein 5 n=1 Tax=Angiostrongylus cantonensis TaxID=6313 RepID=A0A0K0CW66_ANGCA
MDEWEFADEVDILAKLPENFDELRESKKWQERKEALDILSALLDANVRLSSKASYGEILGNLQTVKLLTDAWKRWICERTENEIIPVVFDKLKEKRPLLRDPLVECADTIAATIPSLDLIVEEIEENMKKPNPQIKQQVDAFLYRQLNALTIDKAPKKLVKTVVPLLIKHSGDADQDVRESSLSAIGSIQRLIGERNIRPMIGDLSSDEAKMKKIGEYATKAAQAHAEEIARQSPNTGPAQQEASGLLKSECGAPTSVSAERCSATAEADSWDSLEAVDVLAKLPEDFNTNIESKKWTERRDALQTFLDILVANPKLDPKVSYGEHVALLRRIIEKDANINVASLAAKCMKGLAMGLRKKFAPHVAAVTPAIFDKFKEKKPILRDPLVECIDAVASTTTLEAMGDDIIVALEKPNPNIKIQADLFLYRAFKQLDSQTMPKKTIKALAPLLIKHTADSDAEVRDASYAALGSAMRAIGEKLCLPLLSDILDDKLKMGKIKEFYQKACEEVGPEVITQMIQSIHKADVSFCLNDSLKPPAGDKKKEIPKKVEENEPPIKKASDELLFANDEKQQRLKDERALKILKWNFTLPTDEHVAQLQDQIGRLAKASLVAMLFNKDFRQHLKAIELLNKVILTDSFPSLVKNSDLLLKWCTLRFYETNPAVLIKVGILQVLVLVQSFDEPMSTEEMYAFVPHLLIKSGEQKESMRNAVREIIDVITDICGPLKMCPTLLEALKTKNARQRAECLLVLEQYIARAGLTQLRSLVSLATCISDRDNNVRNAAINGLVACYRDEGDQMWRNIGKIGDKERGMLEERIKRSGVAPGSTGTRPGNGVGGKIVVPPGVVHIHLISLLFFQTVSALNWITLWKLLYIYRVSRRSGSSSSISSIDTMDQLEKVIQNISSGLIDVAKDALEQVHGYISLFSLL